MARYDHLITGKTARLADDLRLPAILPKASARPNTPGTMNKLEAAYAAHLDMLQAAGEIVGYWYEPFKLRLAKRTWYTIDFLVWHAGGVLECVEVKGFWRDDARVKFKVAAEKYNCFCFTAAQRVKGRWKYEYFNWQGPRRAAGGE